MYFYVVTSLTVNAIARTFEPGSLTLENIGNGRTILTFTIVSDLTGAAAPRVVKRHRVILVIAGVTEFDGIVWTIHEQHLFEDTGIRQTVTCTDFGKLSERVLINEPIAAGTLGYQVTRVAAQLIDHDITLNPSQADGPSMPEDLWVWMTMRGVLERLSVLSEWVQQWDGPLLSMVEPGATPAPWNIDLIDPNWISVYKTSTLEDYWNEVWSRFGVQGLSVVRNTFVGNNSANAWTLENTLLPLANGQVTISGLVAVIRAAGATQETITSDLTPGAAMWHFNLTTNQLIHDGSQTLLSFGENVTIEYQMNGPGAVFARDVTEFNLNGPFTALIDDPNTSGVTAAQANANGALARLTGDNERVFIETFRSGLRPWQSINIDIDDHLIDNDYLVLKTVMRHVANTPAGHVFRWTVETVVGNTYKQNWERFWRQNTAPAGIGGGSVITTPPAPVGEFPVVLGRASGTSGPTGTTTNHAITMPSHVPGNTLIVIFSGGWGTDKTETINTSLSSPNWTQLDTQDQSITAHCSVYTKVAAVNTETLVIDTDIADQSTHVTYCMTNVASIDVNLVVATGANNDPPSLTPSAGLASYLWLATRSAFGQTVASAAPANFSNMISITGATSAASTDVAERYLNANTLNPGPFTNTSTVAVVGTIAIGPP